MACVGSKTLNETAGFDPGYEAKNLSEHKKIEFSPIAITTKGYVYIWVSNESEATKVWFDDLAVTHNLDIVTQATDYGPWGDVVREQKTNELDIYRYAYQGQYAEKDEETGWEHFELREYDPVIGRTTIIDPAREFNSPYSWVGNNPVSGTDPTGGVSGFDDYLLDAKGNFTLIAETNEADRVYSSIGTDFVQLEYDGQIADMRSGNYDQTKFDYIKFNNDKVSKDFFEFVSKNSLVEWSQIGFGTKSSYVSTGHKPHSEPGGVGLIYDLTVGKYTVRSHIHSHPTSTEGPSGFKPSHTVTGDKDFAKWIYKYNPKVKLQVYEVKTNSYIKYDHNGVIK